MRKIPDKLTKRERKPRWNWAKHAVRNYRTLLSKDAIYRIDSEDGVAIFYFIIRDFDENYEYFDLEVLNVRLGNIIKLKIGQHAFRVNYFIQSSRVFHRKEITKVMIRGLMI